MWRPVPAACRAVRGHPAWRNAALALGSGPGGNCPPDRFWRRTSTITPTVTIGATSTVTAAITNAMNARPLSGCHSRMAAAMLAATMLTLTPVRTSLAVGGRAGTSISATGRSSVSADSSARDPAAETWPIRSSYSSSVSRPCTNAALRVRVTCSRHTSSRSPPPAPAAISFPGPGIIGASHARRGEP